MPRTLRLFLAGASIGALALGGCTANVEADVESMCAAITAAVEHPEFVAAAEEEREPLLLTEMADAIETRELVDFLVEFASVPQPDRQGALEAFASTHGFAWNCAAFEQAFIAGPSDPAEAEAEGEAEAEVAPPADAATANLGQAADSVGDLELGDPAAEGSAAPSGAAVVDPSEAPAADAAAVEPTSQPTE